MTTLTFQTTTLSVINQHNQIWMTITEIGKALGYSDPFKSVKNLYDRNRDEFTENMTALINMPTNGGMQKVRIFSLRGCHLIGMLSHTKVAKDFRKWVLDILDKETTEPQQLALPEPEKKFTLELTKDELKTLAWNWKAASYMASILGQLYPALNKLGSSFAPSAYSCSVEYKHTLNSARKILLEATKDIEIDKLDRNGWNNVLPELRRNELNCIMRLS